MIVILTGYFKIRMGIVVVVVLAILGAFIFDLEHLGMAVVGEVPSGLPALQVPNISIQSFIDMWPLALTLATLGFVESYSIAKAIESEKEDHRVYPNQELFAIGAANVIGSFFQSFSIAGGFSRSAVNTQSGAHTPLASLVSAGVVALVLIFLTPVFYYLPVPVLGAIIIVSVVKLIDWRYAVQLLRMDVKEFLIFISTFLVTIFVGVVQGIVTGVGLSVILLLYRAAYPHVAILGRLPGSHEFRNIKRFHNLELWPHVVILRIDAPLEFINVQYFKDRVEQELGQVKDEVKMVVIDAGPISHIDASATKGIADLTTMLRIRGIRMIWCDVKGPVRDAIYRNGLIAIIGHENIFLDVSQAVNVAIEKKESNRFDDYAHQRDYRE